MIRFHTGRFRAWKVALPAAGFFCALGVLLLHRASAQTPPSNPCSVSGANCGFAISDSKIQKMTPLFKLQAQISQAKIPVGDALFTNLFVNVLSNTAVKCTEPFTDIKVRSGVLNLEIGRSINCNGSFLDDVIAKNNDLSFQVCIGATNGENCLKPIQMGSVPYAIKANYANQSQNAYQAETASRSNYARRLSADSNMLATNQLGKGYFDVQTPDVGQPGTGTSTALVNRARALNPESLLGPTGGFLYWSPTDSAYQLNISAKSNTTNDLRLLSNFNVYAYNTNVIGRLEVYDVGLFNGGLFVPEVAVGAVASFDPAVFMNGDVYVGGANKTTRFGSAQATGAARTVVDMTQAIVKLPSDVVLPSTVTAKPAITHVKKIANTHSGGPSSSVASGVVFCALTYSATQNITGQPSSYCDITEETPGNFRLSAVGSASCHMSCF
jgi:hypothetical protein